MRVRRTAVLGVVLIGWATPAAAGPDFAGTIDTALRTYVLPAHDRFAEAAVAFAAAMDTFCTAPDPAGRDAARAAFAGLVIGFSGVEMFRFGPAREGNRFERVFYWPDRKGRGLKQVRRIIDTEDPTAVTVDRLRQKSVAVQGLPALDYLLFGGGHEALLRPGSFRCRYALAAAGAVRTTAGEIAAGWDGDGGFASVMRSAGPDNPLYRDDAEAVQDLIKAAQEQVQIVRDLKLARVIGDAPEAARPKRAPFWRSNLTLASVGANIEAVMGLMADGGFADLLAEEHAYLAATLTFELTQAHRAIGDAAAADRPLVDVKADGEAHGRLAYALIPLGAASDILSQRYPAALGLTLGFNSLDGD